MTFIPTAEAEDIRHIVDTALLIVVAPVTFVNLLTAVACMLVIHFAYLFLIWL